MPRRLDRLRHAAHAALGRAGIAARRLPPALAARRDAQLEPTLDHLIAYCMLVRGRSLRFVQVGAYDGLSGDQIHCYVTRYGWRGVLVEPQRAAFERLLQTYAGQDGLEFHNVAIGPRRETRTLYTIREAPGLPEWAPQVASFDRAQVEAHGLRAADGSEVIQSEQVRCVPLEDVLEGIDRIDVLQIDVEGFDAEIVRMFDFERHRPALVRFEHAHLARADHDAAVARLIEHGYSVWVEYTDTLAWREPEPEPDA